MHKVSACLFFLFAYLVLPACVRADDKVLIWQRASVYDVSSSPMPWSGTVFAYWAGTGAVTASGANWAGCTASLKSCQLSVSKGQVVTFHVVSPISSLSVWGTPPSGSGGTSGSGPTAGVSGLGGAGAGGSNSVGLAPGAPVGSGFSVLFDDDFGTSGNVRNLSELAVKYTNLDAWQTTANGTKYGADSAPISDAAVRTFTADALQLKVLPKDPAQTTVGPAWKRDAKSGNITAKYSFPANGSWRSKDLVIESRIRMSKPARGYWTSFWMSGNPWTAEMDVQEAFWTQWTTTEHPYGWHTDPVFGTPDKDCVMSWGPCLDRWVGRGATTGPYLTDWHRFTWLLKANGDYVVYTDGVEFQSGHFDWKVNLVVMLDQSFGHTDLNELKNLVIQASELPIVLDVDYIRAWQR